MSAAAGADIQPAPHAEAATSARRRLAAFAVACGVAVAFVVCLTMAVPVNIPTLADGRARYWPAAAAAAALVLGVDLALALIARRRAAPAAPPARLERGDPLSLEVVPSRFAYLCGGASGLLALAAALQQLPVWGIVTAALLPWLPLFAVEAVGKYRRYGSYAFFVIVALLQTGHLGEHTAQVSQLLMTGGDLDQSRGIFGRLDFEMVHFVWDTAIWLTTCAVIFKFPRNGWLWMSFAFASLHETEHGYLYWLYLTHRDFYLAGGLAGIMGSGGVIGSPLARPYLHFLYNFVITVSMLIGLAKQADAYTPVPSAPPPRAVPLPAHGESS